MRNIIFVIIPHFIIYLGLNTGFGTCHVINNYVQDQQQATVITKLCPPVELGEGPYWVEEQNAIYYVDILKGNVNKYFTDSKRYQTLHIESVGSVSLVVPVSNKDDIFIVGVGRSLGLVNWPLDVPDYHNTTVKILHTVDNESPSNRFNDGKCDPQGRLWAGTVGKWDDPDETQRYKASLFSLDSENHLKKWITEVGISNGMAWSQDRKTFYYIDSLTYCLDAYDYEDLTGKIGNDRVVLDFKKAGIEGMPDGMTIDVEGNLWVALFSSNKVVCIDPRSGSVVREVRLPAHNLTSVCWGGKDYSTLFVTSARIGTAPNKLAEMPATGATFAVTGLDTRGEPQHNFIWSEKNNSPLPE